MRSDFRAAAVEETREPTLPWREGAIHMYRDGHSMVVKVERDGQWVEVIRDNAYNASHIVEALGINHALARAESPVTVKGDA